MSDLEQRAKAFATERHAAVGQVRKYTGEPYINHPAAVVELVRSVPHTEEMLAAAWLHDVVEDTETPIYEIERRFGSEVASLVEQLTDVSKPKDGNRRVRKALDMMHTARSSPEAKTIKLADLIDNTKTIVGRDPEFANVYMAEKSALLRFLDDGDPTLLEMAQKTVDEFMVALLVR